MALTVILDGHDIVGSMVSRTVTTAVQDAEFPLPSVAVRVTFWLPRVLQLNAFGVTERVGVPEQLSLEPPSTSDAVMEAAPLASS